MSIPEYAHPSHILPRTRRGATSDPLIDLGQALHAFADSLIALAQQPERPPTPSATAPILDTKRLAFSPAEAAVALGVSRGEVYSRMNRGEIQSRKSGRRRLIAAGELARWLHQGAA